MSDKIEAIKANRKAEMDARRLEQQKKMEKQNVVRAAFIMAEYTNKDVPKVKALIEKKRALEMQVQAQQEAAKQLQDAFREASQELVAELIQYVPEDIKNMK